MGQGTVVQIGIHRLDHRVAAVGFVRFHHHVQVLVVKNAWNRCVSNSVGQVG
jgi:hypothetical protein